MRLVMFDVDDTLVNCNGIDSVCYAEAVKDVLGIPRIDTDWSHYAKVTDWGITAQIVEMVHRRQARPEDIAGVRQSFLDRLRKAIAENPGCFHALKGAPELLERLRGTGGLPVCVATGGWGEAAVLKLRTAGVPCDDLPCASSDDSAERTEIMLAAHRRALAKGGYCSFEKVIYVGDHPGDFANAKRLDYGFIGIGAGDNALRLSAAGALCILRDYTDVDLFMSMVRAEL